MSDRLTQWWRYARAHHVFGTVIGLLVIAAVEVAWADVELDLPAARQGGSISVPLLVVIPIAFAAVVAASMHSHMQRLEQTATHTLTTMTVIHTGSVLLVATVLAYLAGAVAGSVSFGSQASRDVLLWSGIAFAWGRVIGPRLSWTALLAALFPMTYFGSDNLERARWWAVPLHPPTESQYWVISVGVLVLGAAIALLTPWHLHRLRQKALPARDRKSRTLSATLR